MDLSRFSRIDYWSLAAVPVDTFFNDTPVSRGTAFFWSFAGNTYLVTAWHVLSGRHFQTDENLSATGAWPNKIRIWWNPDGKPGGLKQPQDLPLWDTDDNPLWLEVPELGSKIDVALLHVQVPPGMQAYPINLLPTGNVEFGMGQDVFILGFPMKDELLRLPIWKRGSLASEPEIPEKIQPYWLVDTASRSGMSGAPVIQRAYGYERSIKDMSDRLRNPGNVGKSSFLGVYSGRFLGDSKEDAQLGIVWPQWWIIRIIKEHIGQAAYDEELAKEREKLTGRR